MGVFNAWDSFYVIVGSSAGALIGLQFVVMTLLAQGAPRSAEAGAAFATPTVVHFGAVLLLSVLTRVPWPSISSAAVLFTVMGLAGVAYSILIWWRMRRQNAYQPEFEDWLFHGFMPFLSYAILAGAGFTCFADAAEALFGLGAAALLLLFSGIHNAWDSTAFEVFHRRKP